MGTGRIDTGRAALLQQIAPRGLLLVLSLGLASAACEADVFKYVDSEGNIYFSDEPLHGKNLKLEWKRTSRRLAAENREQSKAELEQRARAMARVKARLDGESLSISTRPSEPVSGSMAVRRARYRHLIDRNAARFGLSADLLHAVIRTESAYKANALSHAGACGLMQLMPATARRFKVNSIWDPAENIRGGAEYLRFLLNLFDGDLRLALAGYNAGEGAVKKYGYQIPPYRETQDYVRKVLRHLASERLADNS